MVGDAAGAVDLWRVTPEQVAELKDRTSDPMVWASLDKLESAILNGDEMSQMEAIDELTDLGNVDPFAQAARAAGSGS